MATASIIPVSQAAGDSGDIIIPAGGALLALTTADGNLHPFMDADIKLKTANGTYTQWKSLSGSEAVQVFLPTASVTVKVTKGADSTIAAYGVDLAT